jgi:hypothetical protein
MFDPRSLPQRTLVCEYWRPQASRSGHRKHRDRERNVSPTQLGHAQESLDQNGISSSGKGSSWRLPGEATALAGAREAPP